MEVVKSLVSILIILMSVVGFASMGMDKAKAKKKQWRIPEKVLIMIAFLGGGVGSFLGMRYFRHKTKHVKFTILLPIACVLYLAMFVYITGIA